jgi:hypothetical protein
MRNIAGNLVGRTLPVREDGMRAAGKPHLEDEGMPQKRHKPEEIVTKRRQVTLYGTVSVIPETGPESCSGLMAHALGSWRRVLWPVLGLSPSILLAGFAEPGAPNADDVFPVYKIVEVTDLATRATGPLSCIQERAATGIAILCATRP